MRIFYTVLITLLLPLIVIRLFIKARKLPAYGQRIGERFAINDLPILNNCIWIHAVSVGETMAATPMIKALQTKYPNTQILVTTTTPTGSAQLTNTFGDSIYHTYLPYDLPILLQRFLIKVKAKCLLIMETELWPNTIIEVSKQCPVALINARLSQESFKGYQKLGHTLSHILNHLTAIAASDNESAKRLKQLGFNKPISTSGNIKFDDIKLTEKPSFADNKTVFIAGSTHDGEERLLLDIYNNLHAQHPNLCLALAPRHPERFDVVEQLIQQYQLSYEKTSQIQQRSTIKDTTQVILIDEMGVLKGWYRQSDLAFIGGSLVPIGGHNMIEAMASQIPVVIGHHTHNFKSIITDLEHSNGVAIVSSQDELSAYISRYLAQPQQFEAQVNNATHYLQSSQGALDKILNLIDHQILTAGQ